MNTRVVCHMHCTSMRAALGPGTRQVELCTCTAFFLSVGRVPQGPSKTLLFSLPTVPQRKYGMSIMCGCARASTSVCADGCFVVCCPPCGFAAAGCLMSDVPHCTYSGMPCASCVGLLILWVVVWDGSLGMAPCRAVPAGACLTFSKERGMLVCLACRKSLGVAVCHG